MEGAIPKLEGFVINPGIFNFPPRSTTEKVKEHVSEVMTYLERFALPYPRVVIDTFNFVEKNYRAQSCCLYGDSLSKIGLKRLELVNCCFKTAVHLSPCLERLELKNCYFDKSVFLDFGEAKLISLKIEYKEEEKEIGSSGPIGAEKFSKVSDDCFNSLPDTLIECLLMDTNVTNKTIMKLPLSLATLGIVNCARVKLTLSRASLRFRNCQISGLTQDLLTERIKAELEEKVKEQLYAVEKAYDFFCIFNNRLNPARPPSLYFVGPTGVGKTLLALAMEKVFERKVLRFDMSEYQKEGDVNKLIGSAIGYIGHKAGGQLTNGITMHPKAIVLFDEVEKAHRSVHKLLLGLLDAGRLTDGNGRQVNCKKIIIVMTSNLKAQEIAELDWSNASSAIDATIKIAKEAMAAEIAPEFVGRIYEVIPFRPLSKEMMEGIMKSKVKLIRNELEDGYEINILSIDPDIWKILFNKNFNSDLGLRPLVIQLEQMLGRCLGEGLANGTFERGDSFRLIWKGDKVEAVTIWPEDDHKGIIKRISQRKTREERRVKNEEEEAKQEAEAEGRMAEIMAQETAVKQARVEKMDGLLKAARDKKSESMPVVSIRKK